MAKILENILFTNVNESNKTFTPHVHNTYSIGITHKGLYKSQNLNNTFNFYAYSTRVNNPEELHAGLSHSWDCNYFYPTVEIMKDIYQQIFFSKKIPIFQKHIIEDIELYRKLYKVFQAYFSKSEKMILETYIIDALSYLIKNYSTAINSLEEHFNNSKIIQLSLEQINDSICDELSLDELATSVSLSKYHYLRVFKKELGMTPHQYILNKKVEKAISFMKKGYSITNAAFEAGFSDQSHFNRTFKKYYDYLPSYLNENYHIKK